MFHRNSEVCDSDNNPNLVVSISNMKNHLDAPSRSVSKTFTEVKTLLFRTITIISDCSAVSVNLHPYEAHNNFTRPNSYFSDSS